MNHLALGKNLNNALLKSNQDLLGNESENEKNDYKLYNEVFQENSTLTWTLTKTQKEGLKFISCGYAHTVDKPTLSKIPSAKTIYWKCTKIVDDVLSQAVFNEEFYWDNNWYADGTFDISPTFFKQVYSLHVIKNGTTVPCIFAMLANKKQSTYKKMFKMIESDIENKPKSINMDFEQAAINAGIIYFEKSYIGKLKLNSKSHRVVPRYPMELWSFFERAKQRLPRTNNNVESWHSQVQADVRKKITI
ncbi:hypothetical protein BpHYR1_007434 [Brachionus plicatilis]|uniref:Uncharacterized protein n=1 Tax=Brachionus plicatilis TaxID=10195 RepID=A0A3M7PZL0_BRAPC|nr:hypothetical protein BpHYR1_007434 [Brachionus plicatilis]